MTAPCLAGLALFAFAIALVWWIRTPRGLDRWLGWTERLPSFHPPACPECDGRRYRWNTAAGEATCRGCGRVVYYEPKGAK